MDLPGYDALLSHLCLSDIRICFPCMYWASKMQDFLPSKYASNPLLVHQTSVLLLASSRPLVTKTPLPSRYSFPHTGRNSGLTPPAVRPAGRTSGRRRDIARRLPQHRTCGSAYGVSFKQSPEASENTIPTEQTDHSEYIYAYVRLEHSTMDLCRY